MQAICVDFEEHLVVSLGCCVVHDLGCVILATWELALLHVLLHLMDPDELPLKLTRPSVDPVLTVIHFITTVFHREFHCVFNCFALGRSQSHVGDHHGELQPGEHKLVHQAVTGEVLRLLPHPPEA